MNATTAPSSLVSIAADSEQKPGLEWSHATAVWCRHAVRFAAWGALGLIAAAASYAFGMAAVIFGLLYHMRVEQGWGPTLVCLALGYLSARGSLACMDLAIGSGRLSPAGGQESDLGKGGNMAGAAHRSVLRAGLTSN